MSEVRQFPSIRTAEKCLETQGFCHSVMHRPASAEAPRGRSARGSLCASATCQVLLDDELVLDEELLPGGAPPGLGSPNPMPSSTAVTLKFLSIFTVTGVPSAL